MRYVVIGTSCSGKTTLAGQIAQALDIPHVELDALHWEPNWQMTPAPEFRQRVAAATAGPAWALDGNYSKCRDIVWGRASHLVWLDYSFGLVMWRAVGRTSRRVLTRQELWNGNRETWRQAVSRHGILWWVLTTYGRRRREYPVLISRPEHAHLTVYRFRKPADASGWVHSLKK